MLNFACVAEAVAHFYERGYETTETHSGYRIMRNLDTGDLVEIIKTNFLEVKAYLLQN